MTLKQKFTQAKQIFTIIALIIMGCPLSSAYSYELNKNIIYYKGFIDGYLFQEKDDWTIICEVQNNDRCLLTQFMEIEINGAKQTLLVYIISENNETYLGVRSKLNGLLHSTDGEDMLVMALSKIQDLKFQLLNTKCTKDFCEYIAVIPDKFMETLQKEDDFIIGINIKSDENIGVIIETSGFAEMFDSINKIK